MKRHPFLISNLLLLLFIGFSFTVSGQNIESSFKLLRIELAEKVNELRASKGQKPLMFDAILQKAAENQSEYMAQNNVLTHEQELEKTATPKKRVLVYGGVAFEVVGENVLFVSPRVFPLSKKELGELAEEMFQAWKNSPKHYQNMIYGKYELGDFAFSISQSSKNIYATQVFGKKGFVVDNQISTNAFGLTEAKGDCNEQFEHFPNIVANMGNAVRIEGNRVMLYYHSVAYFKEMFKRPNDGIAIDLISKKQFPCGEDNKLDFSPIYDGVLLQPVYRDDLLNNNVALSEYRIITQVGTIPSELVGKEYLASVILIQNGKKCRYLVPGEVPSKNYDLLPVKPIVNNPENVSFVNEGIVVSEELKYDFHTNVTSAISLPYVKKYPYKVHSVSIKSYSSVEGDSAKNVLLHLGRAEYIKQHIKNNIHVDDSLIFVDAKENWEYMNFQLYCYFMEGLTEVSHDSLKKIIANNEYYLPWNKLLYDQRKASVIIKYWSSFPKNSTKIALAVMNLQTALETKNYPLANKALYELYTAKRFSKDILFESTLFDACKQYPELVTNYSALLSHVCLQDVQKTVNFLFNWMDRENQLSNDAKFNLIHIYTVVGTHLLKDWDIEAAGLANVIHPYKIQKMEGNIANDELMLNLHLTYIQYFGQINDGGNISKSFKFIASHFKKVSLNTEDDVKLCLFYNKWSMYHYTIEHLSQKFKENKINEDGVFTLAQTMSFYTEKSDEKLLKSVHRKAVELNSSRWCKWISKDYESLRMDVVKELYCQKCNR